jgi:hypothetical protein
MIASAPAPAPPRGKVRHSVLRAVLSADQGAPAFREQAVDPRFSREWGEALRGPLQAALATSARQQPELLAKALTPALTQAMKEIVTDQAKRAQQQVSRWASGLASFDTWRWALQALWEGEPIWDYAQKKAGWFEVVELGLYDSANHRLLAHQGRDDMGRPLDEFVFPSATGSSTASGAAELPVIVLVGGQCRLAVRIAGAPPATLSQQLQDLCFELDSLLVRYSGWGSEVAPLLHRTLERGMMTQGPFSSTGAPRMLTAMALILCLIGAGLVSWMGLREYRWQQFVSALRSEPGIHVLQEERQWGRRTITGLRDPGAQDPAALASLHGSAEYRLSFQSLSQCGHRSAFEPNPKPGSPRSR